MGRGTKGSLRLGVRRYSEDRLDGRNLFRPGDRIEGLASVGFPTRSGGSGAVYVGLLHRAEGTALLENLDSAASQDLLMVGAIWRRAVGGGWLQPRADLRLFRNQDGIGQGFQLGLGTSAELDAGSWVTLVPTLIGRFGNVEVLEGAASRFVGAEMGLSVRMGR